jgi:GGDEF domain-containing protein
VQLAVVRRLHPGRKAAVAVQAICCYGSVQQWFCFYWSLLDGHWTVTLAVFSAFIYSALNVLHFIFIPAPPFFWALYVHFQVFNDQARTRKILIPLLIPLLASTVLTLLNPVTHSMFYLDNQNFFHRGPLFPLLVAIGFSYLLYSLALIISNKHRIIKEYFFPLLGFPLPPVIGSIIQILFYGAFTTHSSITLSLIIVYNNIQAKKLNTDYLTGLYNRMGFQQYLKNKIQSQKEEPFGGIIIDIDNFKRINDRYGHTTGDKVLRAAAALLRKSLRKEDFIARFGGDEFIVIVNARDMSQLEENC